MKAIRNASSRRWGWQATYPCVERVWKFNASRRVRREYDRYHPVAFGTRPIHSYCFHIRGAQHALRNPQGFRIQHDQPASRTIANNQPLDVLTFTFPDCREIENDSSPAHLAAFLLMLRERHVNWLGHEFSCVQFDS